MKVKQFLYLYGFSWHISRRLLGVSGEFIGVWLNSTSTVFCFVWRTFFGLLYFGMLINFKFLLGALHKKDFIIYYYERIKKWRRNSSKATKLSKTAIKHSYSYFILFYFYKHPKNTIQESTFCGFAQVFPNS